MVVLPDASLIEMVLQPSNEKETILYKILKINCVLSRHLLNNDEECTFSSRQSGYA